LVRIKECTIRDMYRFRFT